MKSVATIQYIAFHVKGSHRKKERGHDADTQGRRILFVLPTKPAFWYTMYECIFAHANPMHPVFPKIGNFLLNKRYYFLFAFALLVTGGALFFIPNGAVHAQLEVLNPATWAPQILGSILSVIITGMGVILINIIYVLLVVAQYNTFINSTAVSTGWVIMRDICNMFFVLALLVIAVGTILQQEQYSYKKLLPNFIIMAVMVNFSKTICGVIIDFANVIMATFVAALAQSGGGGFAALLGIPQMMKLAGDGKVDLTTSTVGLFSAFLFMGVALIVMTYAVWALVLRIIALWFLIVLSPLAFTVSVLPEGKTHWNRWWKEFSENVIMGPVLAFFLWLSLAVVSRAAGNAGENAENVNIAREFGSGLSFQKASDQVSGPNGVFSGAPTAGNALASGIGGYTNTAGNLAGYLLGIGMLIGSLVAASEIGGAGGKFAGKGAGYAQDWLQGKKGPSPMRRVRDVVGEYQKIRTAQRQQKVQMQAQKLSGFVGTAKGIVPKAVGGASKALQSTRIGQGIKTQIGNASIKIDRGLQTISGGEVGFGKLQKERLASRKADRIRAAGLKTEEAGQYRALATEAEKEKFRAVQDGDVRAAESAEAARVMAVTEAQKLENAAMADQTAAIALGVRMALPKVGKELGKAVVTAATGPAGAAAMYGGNVLKGIQASGDGQILATQEAEAKLLNDAAGKHKDKSDADLDAVIEGSAGGYSDIDRQGAMKEKLARGKYKPQDVQGVYNDLVKAGWGAGAMAEVDAVIASKYPAQAAGATAASLAQLITTGKIKAESIDAAALTDSFVEALSTAPGKQSEYLKTKEKREAIRDRAGDALASLRASGAHVDATGQYTERYKKLLALYSKADQGKDKGRVQGEFNIDVTTGSFDPAIAGAQTTFEAALKDDDLRNSLLLNLKDTDIMGELEKSILNVFTEPAMIAKLKKAATAEGVSDEQQVTYNRIINLLSTSSINPRVKSAARKVKPI